jgi:hypothetical protein
LESDIERKIPTSEASSRSVVDAATQALRAGISDSTQQVESRLLSTTQDLESQLASKADAAAAADATVPLARSLSMAVARQAAAETALAQDVYTKAELSVQLSSRGDRPLASLDVDLAQRAGGAAALAVSQAVAAKAEADRVYGRQAVDGALSGMVSDAARMAVGAEVNTPAELAAAAKGVTDKAPATEGNTVICTASNVGTPRFDTQSRRMQVRRLWRKWEGRHTALVHH